MITMDIISTLGGVAGIVSLGIVVWKLGFRWGILCRDVDTLKEDTKKMYSDMGEIRKIAEDCRIKIEPFWEIIMQQLPNLISVTRSGNLVEKLSNGDINDEELDYLESEIRKDFSIDKVEIITKLLALWIIKAKKRLLKSNE